MPLISPTSVVLTVFLALVLDLLGAFSPRMRPNTGMTLTFHVLPLLAFTLPLPLFPRLIDFYTVQESNDPTTLLARSLAFFRYTRSRLTSFAPGGAIYTPSGVEGGGIVAAYNKKWDVVLLGGAMGAIISDVTDANTRSKSLALIGLAFSICFTFGPSLGAYFASQPLPLARKSATNTRWNVYAFPAAISVGLLLLETVYLAIKLPETKDYKKTQQQQQQQRLVEAPSTMGGQEGRGKESVEVRRQRLYKLGRLHGFFLLFFSGAEFTLTFLNIGILSSLLQGGYVRRALAKGKVSELTFTKQGIYSCIAALSLMAALPFPAIKDSGYSTVVLYAIASCLAYTSATCVTGMMAAAAACCDEDDAQSTVVKGKASGALPRGRALGGFRSRGQLGRAIGPLWATTLYWTRGPTVAYSVAAGALTLIVIGMGPMVKDEMKRRKSVKVD
ncbi:hypothetical protein QFC21_003172 [Naganishia friedmannii]|uniref:Uncharacterized protein n=1 Tax=Naganishia friedmannii TaxID=89922 RepID=A0ACC2VSG5_9TREE|nr:hypothetical protein QFC21_003172 [Naganishia friedmannii]